MKKEIIYICGPMTGIENFNFPAFDAAQADLEERGYHVVNPAQMDREAGFNPKKDKFEGKFKDDVITRDLEAVMSVDAIAMLPGWENSMGANAELSLARWRGICVYIYPDMKLLMYGSPLKIPTDLHDHNIPSEEDRDGPIEQDKSGLKDSGERRQFSTGSVRDMSAGKGSPALMPILALIALSKHFEKGAMKYSSRNWELGQPYSSFYESADRHMKKWFGGAEDEDHLVAYVWNAICQLETDLRVKKGLLPAELDDRPPALFDENGE